ncbi:MAG: carbohydrate-binding domain-containing protein [Bacteroidales bacterium]|jgi:hypothetical protein|nr:carbohydrate-binding domain-containing protein [Bacteroidales bacterium]
MMKNIFLALLLLFVSRYVFTQENILIHNNGNTIFESNISDIDSVKFQNNISIFNLGSGSPVSIPISSIDSITFSDEIINPDEIIYIIYNDYGVTIINPYENQGISIDVTEFHVVAEAQSGIANIEYHVSGLTNDGSLTVNSHESIILTLSNVSVINPNGSVINVTADNVKIQLEGNNYLSSGSGSSANGVLLCSNSLEFTGNGELEVSAVKKHAIYSGGNIKVENGIITILQAASDGFHSEGFVMYNGTLNITASGDGIDAGSGVILINDGNITINSTANDVKGIKTDNDLTVNGGEFILTIEGAQSKGFSSKQNAYFYGGNINITTSGTTVLEESGNGFDPSYCTAVKVSGNIEITNANINIQALETCNGGKGLSADGNIIINSGVINISTTGDGDIYTDEDGNLDSFACTCITADNNINIFGGTIICHSSGLGGKGISADADLVIGILDANNENLILNVTTTGERFYVSGYGDDADYANPKAIKSDGNLTVNSGIITISCTQEDEGGEGLESKATLIINGGEIHIETFDDSINASDHIEITNGNVFCLARGNDGIDSNGTLTISGGFVFSNGTRAPEAGFDCDNSIFKITGGTIIGTGGSTSNPTANVSTQRTIIYRSGASGDYICISNPSGDVILMLEIPTYTGIGGGPGGGNQSVILFSDSEIVTGNNYTLHYGGTITGGTNVNGYIIGGTYSGGQTKTFNVNSMLTTIN